MTVFLVAWMWLMLGVYGVFKFLNWRRAYNTGTRSYEA